MKRAFTLIELLVVIAIIAILAAILFPVFAQAKAAAKKTAATSNIKQIGTSIAIYETDADDQFPSAYWHSAAGVWITGSYAQVPADLSPLFAGTSRDPARVAEMWANSVQPYMKSYALLELPGQKFQEAWSAAVYSAAGAKTTVPVSGVTFNGLLSTYNASAVGSPSNVPMLWPGTGKDNVRGAAFADPLLDCGTEANVPCVYKSGAKPTSTSVGGWLGFWALSDARTYSGGATYTACDTSAKFRKLVASPGNAGQATGAGNWRLDPMAQYTSVGVAAAIWSWSNNGVVYPLTFSPDAPY